MEYNNELWLDVENFEGHFMVSNYGNVKSLKRIVEHKNGKKFLIKSKILKQSKDKDGYRSITLGLNGKKYTKKVHRLVGKAFIENPLKLPEINHRNGIKSDNNVSNLEWSTAKDNTNHAFKVLKRCSGMKNKFGKLNPLSKPVHCCTFDIYFESCGDAERKLGISGVGQVCNGNLQHTNGIVFRFV